MKGCTAAIMRIWRFHAQRALADAAAGIGAIEHRQMLGLQMRRAFQGHGAADMQIGGVDIGAWLKPSAFSMSKSGASICGGVELQHFAAEFLAQRPFVEDEADVEGRFQRRLRSRRSARRQSPWPRRAS